MREQRPQLARNERHERELDLHRVGLVREPQPVREPRHVRVDDHTRDPVGVPEHDIRGLPSDAPQRGQLLERARYIPAMLGHDVGARLADRLRLVAEEPRRVDRLLERSLVGGGERRGVGIRGEQRRRHLVDALVGALGGEDRRDQQLERRAEVERALRIRVELLELLDHRPNAHRVGGGEAAGAPGAVAARGPDTGARLAGGLCGLGGRGGSACALRRVLRASSGGPGAPGRRSHPGSLRELRAARFAARTRGSSGHRAAEPTGSRRARHSGLRGW